MTVKRRVCGRSDGGVCCIPAIPDDHAQSDGEGRAWWEKKKWLRDRKQTDFSNWFGAYRYVASKYVKGIKWFTLSSPNWVNVNTILFNPSFPPAEPKNMTHGTAWSPHNMFRPDPSQASYLFSSAWKLMRRVLLHIAARPTAACSPQAVAKPRVCGLHAACTDLWYASGIARMSTQAKTKATVSESRFHRSVCTQGLNSAAPTDTVFCLSEDETLFRLRLSSRTFAHTTSAFYPPSALLWF